MGIRRIIFPIAATAMQICKSPFLDAEDYWHGQVPKKKSPSDGLGTKESRGLEHSGSQKGLHQYSLSPQQPPNLEILDPVDSQT